jgi:hypothetical protein
MNEQQTIEMFAQAAIASRDELEAMINNIADDSIIRWRAIAGAWVIRTAASYHDLDFDEVCRRLDAIPPAMVIPLLDTAIGLGALIDYVGMAEGEQLTNSYVVTIH